MKGTIRWGIWGTGAVAHLVASDFQLVSGASLAAVASRTKPHARDFAAEHGVARWYEGLESLLKDEEVDVVYIATPNHLHLEDCLACIHAGKAVLCEKPFALNRAQAQIIVDAARFHDVFCMEGMWTRFIPAVIEAKRRIDACEIGTVRLIEGNFAYPVPRAGNGRLFDIDRGGGALLDRGVYVISLTNYLLGKPDSIQGSTALGPTGVDEQSSYELLFADGTIAALTASFLVRGTNEFVISGEYGSIRICEPFFCAHRWEERSYARQAPSQTASIQTQGARPRFAQRLIKRPTVKLLRRQLDPLLRVLDRKKIHNLPFAGNGYQFEVMEVNRCLRDKRTESDIMSLDDSLEVLRLMDALRSQWGLVYPQECLELKSLR